MDIPHWKILQKPTNGSSYKHTISNFKPVHGKVVQITLMGYFHCWYLTSKCMGFLCVMLVFSIHKNPHTKQLEFADIHMPCKIKCIFHRKSFIPILKNPINVK